MREILFRGKRTDTGEWVEGYYEFGYDSENEEPTHYMWVLNHTEKYGEMFTVIPETVGQYTGLTDKNDKKIFEGDIVKCIEIARHKEIISPVVFLDGTWFLHESEDCDAYLYNYETEGANRMFEIEVIGNIHDNPELLKESEDTE